jgi:hypothetical protein
MKMPMKTYIIYLLSESGEEQIEMTDWASAYDAYQIYCDDDYYSRCVISEYDYETKTERIIEVMRKDEIA